MTRVASRTYELELRDGKVKVVGYDTTLIGIEHKPVRYSQTLFANVVGRQGRTRDAPNHQRHACS